MKSARMSLFCAIVVAVAVEDFYSSHLISLDSFTSGEALEVYLLFLHRAMIF
jgi:hypothetical protein